MKNKKINKYVLLRALVGFGFLFFALFLLNVKIAQAASLSISPNNGSFSIGTTFDVSLYLDTQGQSINALEVVVDFPAERLQIVSPSSGRSIIEVWTAPPAFNNQTGKVTLTGGIPGGINVSRGLITTLSFRVKSAGTGIIRFSDGSRLLLNDGKGTDVLKQTSAAIYEFTLPPPAGPLVVSPTHSDQSKWYNSQNLVLQWAHSELVQSYSYVLNNTPVEDPDDIPEGLKTEISYQNLADGIYYFHIKSLRAGIWGGVTHYAVNIDKTPPAEFKIDIVPRARTTIRSPILQFFTTDNLSGVDHYELKIVPLALTPQAKAAYEDGSSQRLFIEAQSPYVIQELELGKYDVIVRAFDFAGNYHDSVQNLAIVNPLFRVLSERGLEVRSIIVLPWPLVWSFALMVLAALFFLAWRLRNWHRLVSEKHLQKHLPKGIKGQLEELNYYRSKYGKLAILLIAFGVVSLFNATRVSAQELQIDPPVIEVVSRNISNEEIFYVGGYAGQQNARILVYLQNLVDGQTFNFSTQADERGQWFYRHNAFLTDGNYLLWAQTQVNEELSPPTPQVNMIVRRTALQIGSSRFSYEVLYLILVFVFGALSLILLTYSFYHGYHGRKKHSLLAKEIREAEESIRRGFAVLRRDIEAELGVIKKAKLSNKLTIEQKAQEKQLLADLDSIQEHISQEIWEVERGAEH